jgi:hypothetical protein
MEHIIEIITKVLAEAKKKSKINKGLMYAIATNLAKYGNPRTPKDAKPATLTKSLEKKREKYIKDLKEEDATEDVLVKQQKLMDLYKSNKRSFVKQYGKDAEKVMYGTAMKKAKNSKI